MRLHALPSDLRRTTRASRRPGVASAAAGVAACVVAAAVATTAPSVAAASETRVPDSVAPATPAGSELVVDFDSVQNKLSDGNVVATSGRVTTSAVVRESGPGRARPTGGWSSGVALRLPAGEWGAERGALAVLAVEPDGWAARAALDPRDDAFSFGLSFLADEVPDNRAEGDNLLQRGTWGSAGQMKLQVDRRTPSCRVQGNRGAVLVQATTKIEPGTWYSATCRRSTGGVTLTLTSGKDGQVRRWTSYGATGSLSGLRYEPFSVGGKVSSDGDLVPSSPDQFDGVVDDVFVDVER